MPSSASQALHIVPIRPSREAERLRLVIWAVWRVLEEHRHRLEIIVLMVGHLRASVSIVPVRALVVLLAPTESRIVVVLVCAVTAMVRAGTQLEEIGQNVLPAIGLANASLAMVRASASIAMAQARASSRCGYYLSQCKQTKEGGLPIGNPPSNLSLNSKNYFLFKARSIATAIATVAPTIGLLPMPRKPIIST